MGFSYNHNLANNMNIAAFMNTSSTMDQIYYRYQEYMYKSSMQIAAQTPSIFTQGGNAPGNNFQMPQFGGVQQNPVNPGADSGSSVNVDPNSDLKPGLFKGRLAGQEALVSGLAKKYGVSPALVASIIGLESGWGESPLAMNSNNFMGLKGSGDAGKSGSFARFSSIEKGLEAGIKNLASYASRFSDVNAVDFNNLDAIARHYCNAGWAGKVREMYNSNVKRYLA